MALDPSNMEESFLTVADVAELLKLNQQTVRNWIDQGSLPALKVGRRVRIRRSELERVLQQAERTPAAQDTGPSAEDFWGGELARLAEPVIPESASVAAELASPVPEATEPSAHAAPATHSARIEPE